MIRDLNIPVQLVACPIIRDDDGLAMSSRNRNLSANDRRSALILHRTLRVACRLLESGETNAKALRRAMLATLAADPDVRVDYAAVVDPLTLLPVEDIARGALIAVAAWVGSTRLIDNLLTENLSVDNLLPHNLASEVAHV
jgi:pantoate--beta-alanine ligase